MMKKNVYFVLLVLIMSSCQQKKIMDIKQISSLENVLLFHDVRNPNKDSINISLPLEYKLTKNIDKIYSLKLYFVSNGNRLESVIDFKIFNKANNKLLSATEELNPKEIPDHIIIRENDIKISIIEAKKLLKKYNAITKVSEIKDLDTISLTSYNQFKNDNPSIIKNLRKINDSIIFVMRDGKNPNSLIIKQKINW